MTAILYKGDERRGRAWRRLFRERVPDVEFRSWPDVGDAGDIRYLATWEPIDDLEQRFPELEVLFSTGAGVDQFDLATLPAPVWLVRLIDPAIVDGMREYVFMSVLLLQRQLLDFRLAQSRGEWQPLEARSARELSVGIMGLGVLGTAVADALKPFGYALRGWSRSPHDINGVRCFSGPGQLAEFVGGSDIIVCILPLTGETRGILDRSLFQAMPRGGGLVNVGRGEHLCEHHLLDALADGQLSGAVLDVFLQEPLPADHPFWTHDRIVVTPHIASSTGYESAAAVLIDNIRRHRRGEGMIGVVDRDAGY